MNTGTIPWHSSTQATASLCTATNETIALAKVAVKVKIKSSSA